MAHWQIFRCRSGTYRSFGIVAKSRVIAVETARGLRMLGVLNRNLDDEELGSQSLLEALTSVEERNVREAIILHGELSKSLIASLLYWRYRGVKRSQAEMSASRDKLAQRHNSLIDSSNALERVAHSDALTGPGNRHALTKIMEQCLAKASEQRRGLCVQLLDLDFFKQINDKHGHLTGDAVLREVATRLTATLPANTAIGRWGGEEFILLLEQINLGDAQIWAEKSGSRLPQRRWCLKTLPLISAPA